jgi:predicted house-cleaning noncanonical NTP pyrophosphatase (MazG superfamily)
MENNSEMSKNAVLVNLSIRTWAANAMDQTISTEIAENHGTDKKMGRFWKTLVAKGKGAPLGDVYVVEREARKFHYENTLPWMHDGLRILPTTNYQLYMAKMREYKVSMESAVAVFANAYESMKLQAQADLKTLYRDSDYPTRTLMLRRFGLEIGILPMPKSETFVDAGLSGIEVERIKRELESDLAITFQRANEDLWTRLYSCVANLQERLQGDPQYLREKVLENAADLLELLPRLNVNNDKNLESLRTQLKSTFQGMTAEGLRQDVIGRHKAADDVAAIEAMMASFMGGRPAPKMELKHAA